MSDFGIEAFLVSFLAGTIRVSTPILLAALGSIYSQRSGILNLGLEGAMTLGALAAFLGAYGTGNLWFGLVCGVVMGMLTSLIMGILSISIKSNQVIAGTAITILATGLAAYTFRVVFGLKELPPSIVAFPALTFGGLNEVPFIGPILFNHNILVYIAIVLVFVTDFVINHTRFGLMLRAVGENPRAADSKGINVFSIRYYCMLLEGAFAGLGGAFLSIAYMNTFMDNIVSGRGFIAISVVLFARWGAKRALLAAWLFGGATALQMRLQALGAPVPNQILLALPYILTVIALIIISRKANFPAAFTVPYDRAAH